MNEQIILKLIAKGASRVVEGEHDRLFFYSDVLGLTVERDCNSGNISSAEFKGAKISNSRAAELSCVTIWIDLHTGEVHAIGYEDTAINTMKAAAEELIEAVEAEIMAKEATAESQNTSSGLSITDVISSVYNYDDGVLAADGSYVTEFRTFRLTHIISDQLCIITKVNHGGKRQYEYLLWKYSDGWDIIYQVHTAGQIMKELRSGELYDDITLGEPSFRGLIRTIVNVSGILNKED